jgi:predicted PurR-regulated permease PerM
MSDRVTAGVVYRAVLLAFGLVVLAFIFNELLTLILAVLIMVIIALPLAAFAGLLQRRHVPRAIGATLGLLLGMGVLAGLITLVIPVFSHEVNNFVNALPSITHDFLHRVAKLTGTSANHVSHQIQHFVDSYKNHPSKLLGPIASVSKTVLGAAAAIIVILLTALYTAIHPEPLVSGMVSLFPPRRRPLARHVMGRLRTAYLSWLIGLIIGMVILGGLTYLGLILVGLDFAAFFAVFTAIAMIIPYFGALASSIIPILYALTFSTGKAVLVAIVYVIAHQIESNMIQPLIVARAVKLHPALVAVGAVAVERLFGFVGLIVAVPLIVTFKILVEDLWVNRLEPSLPLGPVEGAAEEQVEERAGRGRGGSATVQPAVEDPHGDGRTGAPDEQPSSAIR